MINKIAIMAICLMTIIILVCPFSSGCAGTTVSVAASGQIAKYYETIDELFEDSHLVVSGTFSKEIFIEKMPTVGKLDYFRELPFNVTQTFKGEPQSSIRVAQNAVSADGRSFSSYRDDTFYMPGEHYILFLCFQDKVKGYTGTSRSYSGGYYWVTGAVQGAFHITGDKVYSRNITGEIPKETGPEVNGIPLEQFTAELKQLMK